MRRPFSYFLNLLSSFLYKFTYCCSCSPYMFFFSFFFVCSSLFPIKSILLSNYHREKLQFTLSHSISIHSSVNPISNAHVTWNSASDMFFILLLKWIVFVCLLSYSSYGIYIYIGWFIKIAHLRSNSTQNTSAIQKWNFYSLWVIFRYTFRIGISFGDSYIDLKYCVLLVYDKMLNRTLVFALITLENPVSIDIFLK